jgi:polysaccharide export outer membrane protein
MKFLFVLALLGTTQWLSGQQPDTSGSNRPAAAGYRLGPSDEVTIRVLDLTDEIGDAPFRLDQNGEIALPLVGRLQVGGFTTDQLQVELAKRFRKYLLDPQVTVAISTYRSEPVSVLGAVNTPGVLQVEDGKTLFAVLSLAGGLTNEAGAIIKITRRKEQGPIPLAGAELDSSGDFMVAQVSVKSIMGAHDPTQNIVVRPFDIVTVPTGEVVYVVGCVKTPGGFVLGGREQLSVLQAIALAQGLAPGAAAKKARILRGVDGATAKMEVPVNVKAILEGKTPDLALGPNDVLFIPSGADLRSGAWKAVDVVSRVAEALVYRY